MIQHGLVVPNLLRLKSYKIGNPVPPANQHSQSSPTGRIGCAGWLVAQGSLFCRISNKADLVPPNHALSPCEGPVSGTHTFIRFLTAILCGGYLLQCVFWPTSVRQGVQTFSGLCVNLLGKELQNDTQDYRVRKK